MQDIIVTSYIMGSLHLRKTVSPINKCTSNNFLLKERLIFFKTKHKWI